MGRLRLHPVFAEILQEVMNDAAEAGIQVRLTSAFRSLTEQRRLFRTLPAGQAAAPGQSFHNFGLAVDIQTSPPDALEEVGILAEERGLRWGGRFTGSLREPWHIDAGSLLTIEEARAAIRPADLVEVV